MSRRFSEAMLPREVDAADTLYVADRDLNIVYSNAEWSRFAADNHGGKLLEGGWNGNVLANLMGKERDRWQHIYRLLLEGRLPHHQETMNCSSPTERRIYHLRVTPERDESARDRLADPSQRPHRRQAGCRGSGEPSAGPARRPRAPGGVLPAAHPRSRRSGSPASTWPAISSRSRRSAAISSGTASTRRGSRT